MKPLEPLQVPAKEVDIVTGIDNSVTFDSTVKFSLFGSARAMQSNLTGCAPQNTTGLMLYK